MGDISGGHGDLVQCMPTWQFFKNDTGQKEAKYEDM